MQQHGGPRYDHTNWSKSDKGKVISYDITSLWNLKKKLQMNLFTKQKQTQSPQKHIYGHQRGKMGRGGGGGRIN